MRFFKSFFIFSVFLALPLVSEAISASSLLGLVNAERAKAGLAPLQTESRLAQAGQIKAADMSSKSYFEHVSPEGIDPWDLLDTVGYGWDWAGENLGMSSDTNGEALIVKAWMESPGHRSIILDPRYTETGIGIAEGVYEGRRVIYVSQFFGLPKASELVAETIQMQPKTPEISIPQPVIAQTKPVSKPLAVVKKAEAEEVIQATTSATVESASSSMLRAAEHPVIIKMSLIDRIKLFFSRLFTFSS